MISRLWMVLGFMSLCGVISVTCDDNYRTETDNSTKDSIDSSDSESQLCEQGATFVETHGQLQVDGRDLKNKCGEPVRLKGVSSMWLNWEYTGYAENLSAMQWMIDNWHINVFRAAMGTEAQNGYLTSDSAKSQRKAEVEKIVDNAIQLGIYVIIDWHTHNASAQQAEAIAFFTEIAQKYGDKPNVLYETWNEPLDVSWSTVVKPYHEAVVSAIRTVDPDNIIIMGTPQWCQQADVGVNDPVVGKNLMYAVHFYSCDHGESLALNAWNAFVNDIPIFVTEWGATTADGGTDNTRVCSDEADMWFGYLDEMNTSFVAWKLDDCNDVSCLLQSGAPVDGGWDSYLHGHASYVISKLLED